MPQDLTRSAFDDFRSDRPLKEMNSGATRYDGDTDRMTAEDGLESWQDGINVSGLPQAAVPIINMKPSECRLWVIAKEDVLHAPETCSFGLARAARSVKHSNLTGGGPAYAGGELVFLDASTVVVNGCSGRYRMTSDSDLKAAASAFRKSGYGVWSMGWNSDNDMPAMFGTQDPEWVEA